jgi:hypothetical protein
MKIMDGNQSIKVKSAVINKDNCTLDVIQLNKKIKSQLVKVTIDEINAVRPSVYKYLLP